MTSVKFLVDSKGVYGFSVKGHSTTACDDTAGKIVCSAVSSAVYMAANTVTDIIGDRADITVEEGFMSFTAVNPSDSSYNILNGLRLHLTELSAQYSNNITINGGAK